MAYFVYTDVRETQWMLLGQFGVIIFFILSGFLISSSVFSKSKEYKFKHYFIDRFARIYTSLLPAIAIILLIGWYLSTYAREHYLYFYGHTETLNIIGTLTVIFQLQGTQVIYPIPYNTLGDAFPLFTLAMEWWIYMMFGLVVFRLRKHKTFRSLSFITLLLITSYYMLYRTIFLREVLLITWILGVCISLYLGKELAYLKEMFILLSCLLFAKIYLIFQSGTHNIYNDFVLVALISAWVFVSLKMWAANIPHIKALANYSFTLYLLHFSILSLLFYTLGNEHIMVIIIYILTNLICYLVAIPTEGNYKKIAKWIKTKV